MLFSRLLRPKKKSSTKIFREGVPKKGQKIFFEAVPRKDPSVAPFRLGAHQHGGHFEGRVPPPPLRKSSVRAGGRHIFYLKKIKIMQKSVANCILERRQDIGSFHKASVKRNRHTDVVLLHCELHLNLNRHIRHGGALKKNIGL